MPHPTTLHKADTKRPEADRPPARDALRPERLDSPDTPEVHDDPTRRPIQDIIANIIANIKDDLTHRSLDLTNARQQAAAPKPETEDDPLPSREGPGVGDTSRDRNTQAR